MPKFKEGFRESFVPNAFVAAQVCATVDILELDNFRANLELHISTIGLI